MAAQLALLPALRDSGITGLSPCRRGDPDPDRPRDPADIRRWAALIGAIGAGRATARPTTAP
ncbi:MAG TPA: hypothetical protein VFW96_07990 [Thermomicrobiales bacterium]|nr:hypothetical protein [Thermomicrobiales bacterium]